MASRSQNALSILEATGKLPSPGASYIASPVYSVPQNAGDMGLVCYTGTQDGTWQLPDISLPPGQPGSGKDLIGNRVTIHNGTANNLQVTTVAGQSIGRGQSTYLATLAAGGCLDLEGHYDGTSYFWAPNALTSVTLAANTLLPGAGGIALVGNLPTRTP